MSLQKSLDFFISFIIFLAFQYFALQWLFYPELSYDEGYYIMGARRIIEGDWFLRDHSFDKPFLHPMLVALSGVVFGESYLGFRILGWLFLSISFWLFSFSLDHFIKRCQLPQTKAFFVLKWSLLVGLFLNPLLIRNSASSMGEGYLLFLIVLILFYYPASDFTVIRKGFLNSFGFAFWIKGSILIWTPLLLLIPNWLALKETLAKWKKVLLPTIILSCIGLWFGLVGKTKLFVFRYLLDVLFSTEGSFKESISARIQFLSWLKIIKNDLGIGFHLFLIVLLVFSLVLIRKQKKISISDATTKHLLVFWMTVALFFIVVTFTKVGLMPRYLISITPLVFFFSLILFVLIQKSDMQASTTSKLLYLYSFLILGCCFSLPLTLGSWKPEPFQGNAKLSPAILSEIPVGATLVNKLIWPVGAYVPKDLEVVEVPNDLRLNRHKANFNFQPALFAYSDNNLFEAFQYYSEPENQFCPEIQKVDHDNAELSESELKYYILKSLKAEGKLEWVKFHLENKIFANDDEFLKTFKFLFKESHAGVKIFGTLKSNDLILGENPLLEFEAVVVLYRGRSVLQEWKSSLVWTIGMRLEKLLWTNKSIDLLPFALIAKRGLTIPIYPLPMKDEFHRPFKLVILKNKSLENVLRLETIKYLKNCSKTSFEN